QHRHHYSEPMYHYSNFGGIRFNGRLATRPFHKNGAFHTMREPKSPPTGVSRSNWGWRDGMPTDSPQELRTLECDVPTISRRYSRESVARIQAGRYRASVSMTTEFRDHQ